MAQARTAQPDVSSLAHAYFCWKALNSQWDRNNQTILLSFVTLWLRFSFFYELKLDYGNDFTGQFHIVSTPRLIATPLLLIDSCRDTMTDPTLTELPGELRYVQYEHSLEAQFLPAIRALISKDLSEPYSVYVYRYFLYQWGHLCFMVRLTSWPGIEHGRDPHGDFDDGLACD